MVGSTSEDDIVERGLLAEQYLSDVNFMSFFDETKDLIAQSIVNTLPEHTKSREKLYFTHEGINQVLGTMSAYVEAKDQVIAKRNAEELPKDD